MSLSHREQDRFVPTEVWIKDERLKIAEGLIDRVLAGRGDPLRQRSFRMNITLCHRGDAERPQRPAVRAAAPRQDPYAR